MSIFWPLRTPRALKVPPLRLTLPPLKALASPGSPMAELPARPPLALKLAPAPTVTVWLARLLEAVVEVLVKDRLPAEMVQAPPPTTCAEIRLVPAPL